MYVGSNSHIRLHMLAGEEELIYKFQLYDCGEIKCSVEFMVETINGRVKYQDVDIMHKRRVGWMHVCISLDFIRQNLSMSIDHKLVALPDTSRIRKIFKSNFETVKVSWDVTSNFPEMFTMLNIFTRYKYS